MTSMFFFAKQVYGMAEPAELISPVALMLASWSSSCAGPKPTSSPS